jgi:hypothetical protein
MRLRSGEPIIANDAGALPASLDRPQPKNRNERCRNKSAPIKSISHAFDGQQIYIGNILNCRAAADFIEFDRTIKNRKIAYD